MSIKLGAIAEIMSINEKGELTLDTKGAVILNCGEIPKLKTLEENTIKKVGNNKDENRFVNSQDPHVIDIKNEQEKEMQIEEAKSIDDDGANDLII